MDGYKKTNIVIVTVVSLLFLLIAGVIYYFYFSDYVKENNEVVEKKESLYVEITDEKVIKELQDIIDNKNLYLLSELEKDIDNMNSLDTKNKLRMYFPIITNIDMNEITIDLIDEYFKNTFKTTMYWDKIDIYCDCDEILYKYDFENNKYVYNIEHVSHDEVSIYPYYSKVIDAKKKNDTYIIKVSYIWDKIDNDNVITKGYASYNDALNDNNKLFEVEDSSLINEYIEQNYETIKDKLHEYTYVFKKENDNYLLVSFEYTE